MGARGAQPAGTTGEQDAATAVRAMFDSIAPRYDLLNHVLSGSIDRFWWWRTARRFRHILSHPQARIADVCCGTGDMTMALLRRRPPQAAPVLAIDFSHQMLVRGAAKFAKHGAIAVEADALHLPIADGTFQLLTTAFGFRNLANYETGLSRLLSSAGFRGRTRHSRLQRAWRHHRQALRFLLPARTSTHWPSALGRQQRLHLPARIRRAFSQPHRDAYGARGRGFPRHPLDPIHLRHRRSLHGAQTIENIR